LDNNGKVAKKQKKDTTHVLTWPETVKINSGDSIDHPIPIEDEKDQSESQEEEADDISASTYEEGTNTVQDEEMSEIEQEVTGSVDQWFYKIMKLPHPWQSALPLLVPGFNQLEAESEELEEQASALPLTNANELAYLLLSNANSLPTKPTMEEYAHGAEESTFL